MAWISAQHVSEPTFLGSSCISKTELRGPPNRKQNVKGPRTSFFFLGYRVEISEMSQGCHGGFGLKAWREEFAMIRVRKQTQSWYDNGDRLSTCTPVDRDVC